ncbi:hypothetical protein K432DRAFT_383295 [Lepidopterella palustris CBS 459.81]|uniref:Uncharacterized protein n=1 Tax=Lepidopterella palustris CBS 459.81 TaxID=1314670 RepID=A0A8E2E8A5_9PEZI|nr:hypothetical protein K432DRAFT_383295 [Lepidopterella palustris CBS 459.81]
MESSHITSLNYNHHNSSHPLPPLPPLLPSALSHTTELSPPPLFTRRIRRLPPGAIRVTVLDISGPSHPYSPSGSSTGSSPPSPAFKWGSTSPTFNSTASPTSTSPPSSPWSPSSPSSSSTSPSTWGRPPPHFLRRKPSPKRESLRALRAKESEACLQRIYERQTRAYLDGTLFLPPPTKSKSGMQLGD